MAPHTKPLFCPLRTSSLLEGVHCAACGRCTACVLLARGSAGSTLPGRGSEAGRVHLIKKKLHYRMLCRLLPSGVLPSPPVPGCAMYIGGCLQALATPGDGLHREHTRPQGVAGSPVTMCQARSLAVLQWRQTLRPVQLLCISKVN